MDFKYAINPNSNKPVFQVNDYIGFDKESGEGIDGRKFSKEFFEIDNLNPNEITTYVNTMGGNVKDGFDMFTAIHAAKAKTHLIYNGFGYSTGGWFGMGADEIDAYSHSSWMCHLPYDPENPDETSPFINAVANSIATVMSEKSGRNGKPKKSVEDVLSLMKEKTYFTAKQLYDEGLIDNVINCEDVSIDFQANVKNEYKKCQQVFNKFIEDNFKIKKIMSLDKVVNRLNQTKIVNLAPDSDEQSVLAGIARLENEINAVNSEKDILQNKLKALNESQEENQKKLLEAQNSKNQMEMDLTNKEADLAKMKNEYDAMVAENKVLKEEKEAAENKAKEDAKAALKMKAENKVEEFINCGKIKSDDTSKELWVKKLMNNFDEEVAVLELLPTNFRAPKPTNTGNPIKNDSNDLLKSMMEENKAKYQARNMQNDKVMEAILNGNK